MDEYQIVSKLDENRFEAVIDSKVIGEVDYYMRDEGKTMVVTHTGVRSEYEGQGIAGALNKALMEYAKDHNLHVTPVCSYTRAYMLRHPEYDMLKN